MAKKKESPQGVWIGAWGCFLRIADRMNKPHGLSLSAAEDMCIRLHHSLRAEVRNLPERPNYTPEPRDEAH